MTAEGAKAKIEKMYGVKVTEVHRIKGDEPDTDSGCWYVCTADRLFWVGDDEVHEED